MALVKCNHCRKETKNDTGKCRWCNKELEKNLDTIDNTSLFQPKKWICIECEIENIGTFYSCKKCNKVSDENLTLIKNQFERKLESKKSYLVIGLLVITGFFLGLIVGGGLGGLIGGNRIAGSLMFPSGIGFGYMFKYLYESVFLVSRVKNELMYDKKTYERFSH